MSEKKTFKFEAYARFAILFLIAGFLPALSIHELATTGTIDWSAVTSGRREIPHWLIYPIGWLCFLTLAMVGFVPAISAILRGYVFEIESNRIRIGGEWISRTEIGEGKWIWTGGMRLKTTHGNVHFYPRLSPGGPKAVEAFLNIWA
ncbi:hypothetical protein [Aurantiacibacter gilvus]|uniref:DUF304 domain-containing protein n=1 Tax=Aurantiacibacter gilvus TaxID=3139141 RepID=A0ABU9IDG3_9SPHN